ncbi:hypothetical protein OBBRIDRAFT_696665, partial [Obba rivulosa]
HHWAWTIAEVLHRDVSINNVMFYRDVARNSVIGVLCDWDLANKKDLLGPDFLTSEELRRREAKYRTGTGPFMAIELLNEPRREAGVDLTPNHQYRHDLESFFYVLVWF